jgi:hypothetical protein
MDIRALAFVRKMRGGAQAHLIQGTDRKFYVVKFLNNPQHRRIVINEWLGSAILHYLGISTPTAELVHVDQDFVAHNKEAYLATAGKRQPPCVGPHFASCYPGDPSRTVVYDFLPDALLYRVENLSHFLGAMAFDKWTSNTDGRQAIFFRALTNGQFVVQMLDQGFAFGGPAWRFQDSPIQGAYFRPAVYGAVPDLSNFEPWLNRIQNLPFSVLQDAASRMPPSWLEGEEPAIWRLLDQLFTRRQRLATLMEDHLALIKKSAVDPLRTSSAATSGSSLGPHRPRPQNGSLLH